MIKFSIVHALNIYEWEQIKESNQTHVTKMQEPILAAAAKPTANANIENYIPHVYSAATDSDDVFQMALQARSNGN